MDASSTVVSLASKNGVVTAIEKTITSKLCIEVLYFVFSITLIKKLEIKFLTSTCKPLNPNYEEFNMQDDGRRINNVTTMIGISGTGYYPDYRSLLNYSHEESSKYLKEFRDVIPVKKLADTVIILEK